jgi:mono/diheme cytochrome c family protein
MKIKLFTLLMIFVCNSLLYAQNIDWSDSSLLPISPVTIRAHDLKYTPTPNKTWSIDFHFNPDSLNFEPDFGSLSAIDHEQLAAADIVRGGKLYDKWWAINGQPSPSGNHPLYPTEGSQMGANTWRCAECHGWDYKGQDGAQGPGSDRFTGISGLSPIRHLTPGAMVTAIKRKNLSLSEQDMLDLIRFLQQGMIDMDKYIIFSGPMAKNTIGNALSGRSLYINHCSDCHGLDGNSGTADTNVRARAISNPWKALHKISYGNAGTSMPSMISLGLSLMDRVNILAYLQSLSNQN